MSDNTPAEPLFKAPPSLLETLLGLMKRGRSMRQVVQILRTQRKRQPLGYGAKLRMRRMDWIRESQTQGIAVALDRKVCRSEGRLSAHLTAYYPMHRHTKADLWDVRRA